MTQLEALLGLFACTPVGSLGSRWRYDTSVTCFTGQHAAWAFGLGLPGLLLLLIVTVAMATHLRRQPLTVRSGKRMLSRFGLMYDQYRDDQCLWELVAIVQKAALLLVFLMGSAFFPSTTGQASTEVTGKLPIINKLI